MQIPYIEKNGGYRLYFEIPLDEYNQWKSNLSKFSPKNFENFAKILYETRMPSKINYPKLRWNKEGELVEILLGDNCACVQSSKDQDSIKFYFHNIDFPDQAIVALEILAKYFNFLKEKH